MEIVALILGIYFICGGVAYGLHYRSYHRGIDALLIITVKWLPLLVKEICSFIKSAVLFHKLRKKLRDDTNRENWKRNNSLY